MKSLHNDEIQDPILYRLYWRLILPDILTKLQAEVTPKNKKTLHEFNKRVLGYKSIAGKSKEYLSNFIFDVAVWWAVEQGIFVRTNKKQPENTQELPFSHLVKMEDGTQKKLIDLL